MRIYIKQFSTRQQKRPWKMNSWPIFFFLRSFEVLHLGMATSLIQSVCVRKSEKAVTERQCAREICWKPWEKREVLKKQPTAASLLKTGNSFKHAPLKLGHTKENWDDLAMEFILHF